MSFEGPLALLNFGANLLDKAYSHQRFDAGISELERLRGPEGTGAKMAEGAVELHGRNERSINQSFGNAMGEYDQFKRGQGAGIEEFQRKAAKDLRKNVNRLTNETVQGAKRDYNSMVEQAEMNVKDTVADTNAHIEYLKQRADSDIQRLEGQRDQTVKMVRSDFKTAIQNYENDEAADYQEFAAQINAAQDEAQKNADAAMREGTTTPQAAALMKTNVMAKFGEAHAKTARGISATRNKFMAGLRTQMADTTAKVLTDFGASLGNLSASLTSTLGVEGRAANEQRQIARQGVTDAKALRAEGLRMARTDRATTMSQAIQTSNNNIAQAKGLDKQFDLNVSNIRADLKLKKGEADRMNDKTLYDHLVAGLLNEQSVGQMLASANFGWAQTVIPLAQATGELFDDVMTIWQANIAQQNADTYETANSFGMAAMQGGFQVLAGAAGGYASRGKSGGGDGGGGGTP